MSCIRKSLLAGLAALAAAVSAAWGAVQINDVHVTNVGTSTCTVVWTTSEVSTPGLEVFTDAAGTQAITASLGLEFYPLAEGDVAVVNEADAREARRSLELLAVHRRVVAVNVTGLEPGTAYYVRPRSFDDEGSSNAEPPALQPVTTAQFTSMVSDARLLRVRFPTVVAEGMIALVQGPAGTTPLSMFVGDSADGDTALIPLANLVDGTTGTNALYAAPQEFSIRLLGADAPAGTFKKTIDFAAAFNVAKSDVVEVSFSSAGPLITAHPADQKQLIGGMATFVVEATGTPPPSYQWQRKLAGTEAWTDLANGGVYAGATTATLSVSNLTYGMHGDQFRAVASNGNPPPAYSDPAVLSVNPLKVARGAFVLDRRTGRLNQQITITNQATTAVPGPIRLVLDGLSSNTQLLNATGSTVESAPAGSPYLLVTSANLAAGTSVKVTLQFKNPTTGGVAYETRTLTGEETP